MGSILDPKAGDRAQERSDIQQDEQQQEQQRQNLRAAEETDITSRSRLRAQKGGVRSLLIKTGERGVTTQQAQPNNLATQLGG